MQKYLYLSTSTSTNTYLTPALTIGHLTCKLICKPRGVDRSGRARVNELLNELINQGDEDWVTVGPLIMKYNKSIFFKKIS